MKIYSLNNHRRYLKDPVSIIVTNKNKISVLVIIVADSLLVGIIFMAMFCQPSNTYYD